MTIKTVHRSIAALLLLAACDVPPERGEQGVVPPPVQGPAAGTKPVAAAGDASRVVHDYGNCYAGCFDEKVIATDKETCKLNCGEVAEAARAGLGDAPAADAFQRALAGLSGCVQACHEDRALNTTDRETCILTCQDVAEVAATPMPSSAPAKP